MQIVAFAILGLVLTIVGFILQFLLPDIKIVGWGMIAIGLIFLFSSFIIEFRRVRSAMVSHRGKYSASTTILISAFLGIMLIINAAAANLFSVVDLTGLSQFTLTEQTKEVLREIDKPIDVICFFVPSVKNIDESLAPYYAMARAYAPALLSEYTNHTNRLNIRIVDPEERPEFARSYGITSEYYYQSVVFETELGIKYVHPIQIFTEGENAFTSAILQVTGNKLHTIYFLTGHGEKDPNSTADSGYSSLRQELRNRLFDVRKLDLLDTGVVPDDCTLLIVAGPTAGFSENEQEAIIDYLDNAGKAIFLTDPGSPGDIAEIGALWGFDVGNGTIIDPDFYVAPNKDVIFFGRNQNTFGQRGITNLYFPGLTAVEISEYIPQNMAVVPLLLTGKNAWMTDAYDPRVDPVFDPENDFKQETTGIITGLIIEPSLTTETVIVGPSIAIIGDSDFVSNRHFYNGDNGKFLLQIISEFTLGVEVTDLAPRPLQARRLILTPEKSRFLNVSSVALLPGLVLVFGFVMWWRRR